MSGPTLEGPQAAAERATRPKPALTAVPWSLGSAVSLVAIALVLLLLAGAVATTVLGRPWSSQVEALLIGGVLLLAYAGQMGLVWGSAGSMGVGFSAAVGLRRTEHSWRWAAIALGAALAAWLFSVVYSSVLSAAGIHLPGEELQILRILPDGPVGATITILLAVLVAPFAEEVVFRGVLLPSLRARWGTWIGIGGSAVVFSAVHASLYELLPLLVLGVVLGALFVRSRSLWVCVLAHSAFNALGVAALLFTRTRGLL